MCSLISIHTVRSGKIKSLCMSFTLYISSLFPFFFWSSRDYNVWMSTSRQYSQNKSKYYWGYHINNIMTTTTKLRLMTNMYNVWCLILKPHHHHENDFPLDIIWENFIKFLRKIKTRKLRRNLKSFHLKAMTISTEMKIK